MMTKELAVHRHSKDLIEKKQVIKSHNFDEPVKLQSGHKAAIYSIDFSPCGNYLASGGFDRIISIWEMFPQG